MDIPLPLPASSYARPLAVFVFYDELERLTDRVSELEEALRFYVGAFLWQPDMEKVFPSSKMFLDKGNVGRRALGMPEVTL